MSINRNNIVKWWKMIKGESILHVNQDLGNLFIPGKIYGYFNNFIEKVDKEPKLLKSMNLPLSITEKGEAIQFPVAIFQYGLGSYDLYLKTKKTVYFEKFIQTVQWALANQEIGGGWPNFYYIYPDNPYGAMCQGEGASLLIRMYIETKDVQYLEAAISAINFMLLPVEQGGTSIYRNDILILLEYTHREPVLNGWIFAIFGLHDILCVHDSKKYRLAFDKTINSLKKYLERFDTGYWSYYDLDQKIASPFYHNLHIAQLEALYLITNQSIFLKYRDRFNVYKNNKIGKNYAFVKKIIQKIIE